MSLLETKRAALVVQGGVPIGALERHQSEAAAALSLHESALVSACCRRTTRGSPESTGAGPRHGRQAPGDDPRF